MDTKWILTDKELPHNMCPVLVWLFFPEDEYEIDIAYYCKGQWRHNDYEGTPIEEEVIAWMPLPKPILKD